MKRCFYIVLALVLTVALTSCASAETRWQEQYDLGVRYLSEGNYQEAIIAFTAAIEIDPKQALAYVGRGDAYVASGETEENLTAAQTDYEKALELDETLAEAYLGLSDIYIRQGEYEQTMEILQKGLEQTNGNQDIENKISELGSTSGEPSEIEETVSYNAYGGTEFTQRNSYRDVETLSSEEITLLRTAMDLTIANDMYELYQLGATLVDSDEDPRDIGVILIRTIFAGYKVEFFVGFPNEKRENMMVDIEFRPENGIGYCVSICETSDWNCRWASCECANWQWNGIATIIEIVSGDKSNEGTVPIKNGLRDGTFVRDYEYFTSTTVYRGGLVIEYDGEPQEPDNTYWSMIGGYYGPLEDQVVLDRLYW